MPSPTEHLPHHVTCLVKVTPTLCNPMDPTIVHGILPARILEWVAFPFSRGSPQPRDQTQAPTLWVDSLPADPQGKPCHLLSQQIS